MPAKKKLHEATSLENLVGLISELEANKERVQKLIQQFPEDLKNHRVFCAYAGKINDILKLKIQTEKVDPFHLLSETLQTVAIFLAENEEVSAAHYIGDHVEEIEEKILQQWWNYQEIDTKDKSKIQKKELKKVSNLSEKGVRNKS